MDTSFHIVKDLFLQIGLPNDNHDIDNFCKEYQNDGNIIDPIEGFVLSEDQDFIEWLEKNKQDEIFEAFNESEHYPMWSTLFEFRSCFYS